MSELHLFRDDAKTVEQRIKPIGARYIDDNFKMVRLKLDSQVEAIFQIVEAPATRDTLALAAGYPTSGTWVLAIQDGSLTWIETEECS